MTMENTTTTEATKRKPTIELIPGLMGWELLYNGNVIYNFGDLSTEIHKHSIGFIPVMCADLVDVCISDLWSDDCGKVAYYISMYREYVIAVMIRRLRNEFED